MLKRDWSTCRTEKNSKIQCKIYKVVRKFIGFVVAKYLHFVFLVLRSCFHVWPKFLFDFMVRTAESLSRFSISIKPALGFFRLDDYTGGVLGCVLQGEVACGLRLDPSSPSN